MIEVLDTNVISELLRERPHPSVIRWGKALSIAGTAVAAPAVMEARYGVYTLPAGRRRDKMRAQLEAFLSRAVGEIIPVDAAAAEEAAEYLAERRRIGRPLADKCDAMIAGIVLRLNSRDGRPARVATRNVDDFLNVPLVNPWDDPPPPMP